MIVNEPTPCWGKSDLFDSLNAADHAEAKALCDTCPALDTCKLNLSAAIAAASPGGGPEGTWAGQLLGLPPKRANYSRDELAAIEATFTEEDIRLAHNQYINNGARTDWALIGHRMYERKRYHRRKANNNTAA